MEIPTKQDFETLKKQILFEIESLKEAVNKNSERDELDALMSREDIMKGLHIKDYLAFRSRMPELIQHGMFKEGKRFYMFKKDFLNYFNSVKNKNTIKK